MTKKQLVLVTMVSFVTGVLLGFILAPKGANVTINGDNNKVKTGFASYNGNNEKANNGWKCFGKKNKDKRNKK